MSAALGFALAAIAAISLSLIALSSLSARVNVEPRRFRVFKGETAATSLRLDWGGRRWLRTGSLSLDDIPGMETECIATNPSRFELALRPVCAGKFEIATIRLDITDAVGLFVARKSLPIDLTVESLPLALLTPARATMASPLASGENPAGRSGSGQELFAVGPYHPDLDTKDIMWKRVAQMEDASISVRVREANIRMSVRIGVALSWSSGRQRAEMVDLVSEAVAQIGKLLLSLGTSVEVVFASGTSLERNQASNTAELVNLVMAVSGTSSTSQPMLGQAKCDMFILGSDQLEALKRRVFAAQLPVVVVSEEPLTSALPSRVTNFTGREDLSALTTLVLNG